MNETLLEYPFKTRPWVMLAVVAFFGGGAAVMVHAAATNDRGWTIDYLITVSFSVTGATVFYWCIAAVCLLFVLVAIIALAMNFTTRLVRLTSTEVSFPPHGFARKPIVIALSDITLVATQTVRKHRFINIHHVTGKSSVADSMLPNAEAFEKLNTALLEAASLAIRSRNNRQ